MRLLLAGVALVAALMPASARANTARAFKDGNDLSRLCAEPMDTFGNGECLGFVTGISDAMADGNPIGGWSACIPLDVTIGQAADVAKQFLTSHPELRHLVAASLVAAALAQAFPCRR
jgi:hypothetical protein